MTQLNTISSLLFTPGTNSTHFHKGFDSGAGGVILDLEDSVGPADKQIARDNVSQYLKKRTSFSHPFVHIIRINSLSTLNGLEDLRFIIKEKVVCDAISVPKVNCYEELNLICKLLQEGGMQTPLLAQIESQSGLHQVERIVAHCQKLEGLCFGAADYGVDLGLSALNWDSLLYARMRLATVHGIRPIALFDSPFFHIPDLEGVAAEAKKVKNLGFTGKLAIHPSHISVINQVFIPSKEEIERAKQIIATFEKAKGNACQFEGQMIDVPVYEAAKKTITRGKK